MSGCKLVDDTACKQHADLDGARSRLLSHMSRDGLISVRRVQRLNFGYAPWSWHFADRHRREIDALFPTNVEMILSLWNGRLLLLRGVRFAEERRTDRKQNRRQKKCKRGGVGNCASRRPKQRRRHVAGFDNKFNWVAVFASKVSENGMISASHMASTRRERGKGFRSGNYVSNRISSFRGPLPLMDGPYFDVLIADISEQGLREPITLFEDKILDGSNRYHACSEAQINRIYQEYFRFSVVTEINSCESFGRGQMGVSSVDHRSSDDDFDHPWWNRFGPEGSFRDRLNSVLRWFSKSCLDTHWPRGDLATDKATLPYLARG
jgi:hypothetical protein